MKIIDVKTIEETVCSLAKEANFVLPNDIVEEMKAMQKREESPLAQSVLGEILQNATLAKEELLPLCQDTGVATVFVTIGQDVHITGGSLEEAIHNGVAKGYTDGYLRKSMVKEPLFERENTKNNTPAIIHYTITEGDSLHLLFAPKGAGSENKCALKMLVPADGIEGVKSFVMETVNNAGPNSCPPLTVGVGIGGSVEKCAILAKKALFRVPHSKNPDARYAKLEEELYTMIQNTGIGAGGLGGTQSAVGVYVEWYPCHIASLPVAVTINCHSARHSSATL